MKLVCSRLVKMKRSACLLCFAVGCCDPSIRRYASIDSMITASIDILHSSMRLSLHSNQGNNLVKRRISGILVPGNTMLVASLYLISKAYLL